MCPIRAPQSPLKKKCAHKVDAFFNLTPESGPFRILILYRQRARNDVFLFGPRAKVNLLAAIGTKRTIFIGIEPFHFFAAGRAINNGSHRFSSNQKLQSVSSNGTSTSKALGFKSPPWLVKRIQSTYLLAEISGMAPSRSSRATRNIW